VKKVFNFPHFILCLAFIIYAVLLTSSQFTLSGMNSIYPRYEDNLFAFTFLSQYLNYNFLSWTPYFFIPLAFFHYFLPKNKLVPFLGILLLMIISQINQTIYGVDIALFTLYFATRLIDDKPLYSSKSLFLFGLIFIYFFSAIVKTQAPEWRSLESISFILTTNVSTFNLSTLPVGIKYFLKVVTFFIICIELACPLVYLGNKFEKIIHFLLTTMHFFSFLFLRIPHLSLFLLATHYQYYQFSKSGNDG
jgi:hypothetical protein